jgi:hypothetical protein
MTGLVANQLPSPHLLANLGDVVPVQKHIVVCVAKRYLEHGVLRPHVPISVNVIVPVESIVGDDPIYRGVQRLPASSCVVVSGPTA